MAVVTGKSVFGITVTITDHTKGPFALYALLKSGSVTGVTVAPAAGYGAQGTKCATFALEALGPGILYLGDANVANDGSRQGWQGQVGDASFQPPARPVNSWDLQDWYVMADTDNAKFNLLVTYS